MSKEDYKKLGEYAKSVADWTITYRNSMEEQNEITKRKEQST